MKKLLWKLAKKLLNDNCNWFFLMNVNFLMNVKIDANYCYQLR